MGLESRISVPWGRLQKGAKFVGVFNAVKKPKQALFFRE